LTIYIVDDNQDLLEFIDCVLKEAGYKVHIFAHPEDALTHMETSNIQPDTLITDYNLPVMNGYELHRNIHAHAPNLKTIVISGRNVAAEIKGLTFIQKPFAPDYLVKMVKAL